MIEQMLLETFFGALTGYVTNDVAIKGLFKKGGVVEKTRDEFIHEASALLEDQVLTQAVLQERLALGTVEQALDDLLRHFFTQSLPKALQPLKVGELDGYDVLINYAKEKASAFWQREQQNIIRLLQMVLDGSGLLSAGQIQQLAEKLTTTLQEELVRGEYIKRFLMQWLTQAESQDLNQLGLEEVVQSLTQQMLSVLGDWLTEQAETNEAAWQELVQNFWQQLALDELLQTLEQALRVRPLADFCPEGGVPLAQMITEILSSAEGEAVWNKLASRLLQLAASCETPLNQLLGAETKALVLPFVRQQLPDILSRLLDWLAANEEPLNQLIEEAIDEVIMEAGDFKNVMLLMVRESLLQGLFDEHIFLKKAQAFLQEQADSEETAEQLAEKLLSSIGGITPKQLVEKAGGALGPLYRVVRQFLRDNGLDYCRKTLAGQLDALMLKPIGCWLPEGIAQKYSGLLSQQLSQGLIDKMRSEWLPEAMQNAGQKIVGKLCSQPLQETLPNYSLQKAKWAEQGQRFLENALANMTLPLERWFEELSKGQALDKWVKQGDVLVPEAVSALGKRWQSKDLAEAYSDLCTKERLEEMLPLCRRLVSDKLLEAVKGNLSRLAEESLNKLSNEEMLQLVQDFMGKELKPLNYLGALLGGTVGLVTGALLAGPFGAVAAGSTAAMASAAAGRSVVYGAVGYGTNCAAIKGLFWPYKPVAGVRMLQGVVPKQQERFANSLGQMVSRYVLNEDILQDILAGQNAHWQTVGTKMLADPQATQDIWVKLAEKQERIEQRAYQGLLSQSQQQLSILWEKLAQKPIKQYLPLDKLSLSINEQKLGQRLVQEMAAFCRTDKNLSTWLDAKRLLPLSASVLKKQLPQVATGLLNSASESYSSWQKQPLVDMIPSSKKAQIQHGFLEQMMQAAGWEKAVQWIADIVNKFLQEQTLGNAFEGRLDRWVLDNIQRLVQMALVELNNWLASKQEMIATLVQQQIRQQLSFMQLMGYMAMNGDQLVEQIVARLLTDKLPPFLQKRQQEIEAAVQGYWQENLAPLSPAKLSLTITPEIVRSLGARLGQQSGVASGLMDIVNDLGRLAGQVPIENWLASTALKDWQSLRQTLQGEEKLVRDWLKKYWPERQDDMIARVLPLVAAFWQQMTQMSVADVLAPCADSVEKLDGAKLLQQGNGGALVQEMLASMAAQLGNETIDAYLNWQEVSGRLSAKVTALLASADFQKWWHEILGEIIADLPKIWADLPETMRQQLIAKVVQAFLSSVQQKGSAVLKEMNLPQVTSIQVQAMDAQALEKLVHGFAKPYFCHIQNMGWLGAGFAIPGIILSYLLL